jgi:hypothetical protein
MLVLFPLFFLPGSPTYGMVGCSSKKKREIILHCHLLVNLLVYILLRILVHIIVRQCHNQMDPPFDLA